jgi:preprotein translocase subunit YajC
LIDEEDWKEGNNVLTSPGIIGRIPPITVRKMRIVARVHVEAFFARRPGYGIITG